MVIKKQQVCLKRIQLISHRQLTDSVTPAESTTYRFAKHDKEQYPDIITANMNGTPYYTNSSHLPVGLIV